MYAALRSPSALPARPAIRAPHGPVATLVRQEAPPQPAVTARGAEPTTTKRVLRLRVHSERKGAEAMPEGATPILVNDPEAPGKDRMVGSYTKKHVIFWRRQGDRFFFVPLAAINDDVYGAGWTERAEQGLRCMEQIERAAVKAGVPLMEFIDRITLLAPPLPAVTAAAA